jgi:hypothetical protein
MAGDDNDGYVSVGILSIEILVNKCNAFKLVVFKLILALEIREEGS